MRIRPDGLPGRHVDLEDTVFEEPCDPNRELTPQEQRCGRCGGIIMRLDGEYWHEDGPRDHPGNPHAQPVARTADCATCGQRIREVASLWFHIGIAGPWDHMPEPAVS